MCALQVVDGRIVDHQHQPVQLRGVGLGGWMNLENFINGFPGTEHGLRATFADFVGPSRASFFFERLLDHFLSEDDIAFIRASGANTVRVPLNYRHFEQDTSPFHYLESGFERVDRLLTWCAHHDLYAILELHAAQGWQNPDWHCDNASRHALFWQHPHFQDRFVALWEKIAGRFSNHPALASYDLLNEPVSNAPRGLFHYRYDPDWDAVNALYRRTVDRIRTVDPHHIIFLEGDFFASRFDGLDAPSAENLVYSSHNYNVAGFGPGPYPGTLDGAFWNEQKQEEALLRHEGVQFARRHNVPLWAGEFGSVFNGPVDEQSSRLQAHDDQLAVFERHGVHWTSWTYKDVGVMGWVTVDPESDYMQRITPILQAKEELNTDYWMQWLPHGPARRLTDSLADLVPRSVDDPELDVHANRRFLAQTALSSYVGSVMQPAYVRLFMDMSESEIDRVLQSFAFANCRPHTELVDVVRKHTIEEGTPHHQRRDT